MRNAMTLVLVLVLCGVANICWADSVLFDLGDAWTLPSGWNTVADFSAGVHVINAVDAGDNPTSVSLNCSDGFAMTSTGGDNVTAYPVEAGKDSFYLSSGDTSAQIIIGGLTPGGQYDFRFFGSRASAGPRALDISIGAEQVTLDAAYNRSNVEEISQVLVGPGGTVTIDIVLASGSFFGYLGVIEVVGDFDDPIVDEPGIFIAPYGLDSNPGTKAWPKATMQGAMDAAVAYKQANGLPDGGLVINFRGGKYFVDSKVNFTAAHSGVSGKPIIFQSYPGERARFIGGVELDPADFTLVTSSDAVWSRLDAAAQGQLLQMSLAPYGISDYGGPTNSPVELSCNEQIMQMGRWPNGTYVTTASPTTDTTFKYTGTRPERWATAEEPYVYGQLSNGYFSNIIPITDIDTANKVITLGENPLDRGVGANKAWSVVNLLEEIDEPGEYFIDKANHKLYFWPPTDIAGAELLLSTYGNSGTWFLDINNVSYVHFKDFTFEMFRGRFSKVWSSDHLTFNGCTFRNGAASAITFDSTANLVVKNCQLYDMGGTGISFNNCGDRYSLTPANNVLVNNEFSGTGRWKNGLGYAPPVWAFSSNCGLTFRHNLFRDTRHNGLIIFGGVLATVEYNRFQRCGRELDDGAAVYNGGNWSSMQGAIFRYNELYDIDSTNLPGDYGSHGVHGIYFDMNNSGAHCHGNILHSVDDRGFLSNGGRDLHYSNNIVVNTPAAYYSADWFYGSTSCEDLLAPLLAMDYDTPGSVWYNTFPDLLEIPSDCSDPTFDNYRHPRNCRIEKGLTWQCNEVTRGNAISYYDIDTGTMVSSDPKFLDEANQVFALADDSPAYSIPGFERIPWERIGRLDLSLATRPIPLDEADIEGSSVNLYWAPALDAATHKVYLSTDEQAVANRAAGAYLGEFSDPHCVAAVGSGCFFWAVDEYDAAATLMGSGPTWSFQANTSAMDFNNDCVVDLADYAAFTQYWIQFVLSPDGVYAHWPLNEDSGVVAGDVSGNGFDASISGASWTSGQWGAALSFDGDDSVALPALNLNSNTLTFTAWVKRNGAQDNATGLIYTRSASTPDAGLVLTAAGELWGRWNGSWPTTLQTPDGQWALVAFVVEPTQQRMYLHDGALHSVSNTGTFAAEEFDGLTYLGWDQNYPTSRFFKGDIDDVRIYNQALNAAQIEALYQSGSVLDLSDADFNDDGVIDWDDLAAFTADWLN